MLIGGGAYTDYGNGPGALLTESRPNESLTTWIATSKDHINVNSHSLHVYAIGLKLEGISAGTLRNYIKLSDPETSST